MKLVTAYISHKVVEKTFKAKKPGEQDRKVKEVQATFLDSASKSVFTLSALADTPEQAMVPEYPIMTPVEVFLRVKRGDFGDELQMLTFKSLESVKPSK